MHAPGSEGAMTQLNSGRGRGSIMAHTWLRCRPSSYMPWLESLVGVVRKVPEVVFCIPVTPLKAELRRQGQCRAEVGEVGGWRQKCAGSSPM